MADELSSAWNRPTAVIVERAHSAPAPKTAGWRQMKQRRMEEGLKNFDEARFSRIIRIDFESLPESQIAVTKLIQLLDLNPTAEQVTHAVGQLQRGQAAVCGSGNSIAPSAPAPLDSRTCSG